MDNRSHAGSPERSERLRKTVEFLKANHGCTSAELQAHTHSMHVSSDADNLRKCGYVITAKYSHTTDTGARVYRWWLNYEPLNLIDVAARAVGF